MYIQRVPHPLAHFSRDPSSRAPSDVSQTTSINATTSSGVSYFDSHRTAYVVLGVFLTILFLCLVGFFVVRRRVRCLLPCSIKRTGRIERREFAPPLQRTRRQQIADGFNIIPSLTSHTPTSPSSDGPSTPVECEERGDLGANRMLTSKNECSFVPIPIIVHTPTQTHHTTFLTGPDSPDLPEFAVPTHDGEEFFDEELPMAAHGSVIRPHGLPLSPVPEEPPAMVSFSPRHFEVDEEDHPCH